MKKLFFTIGLSLLTVVINAQKFELTQNNLVNSEDQTKDYSVLEFPTKNKHELFVTVKKVLTNNFVHMKSNNYTEIEDEQISVQLLSGKGNLIMLNFGGSNIYYVLNQYEFNFKDGKIMIKPAFLYLTNLEINKEYIKDTFKRKEKNKEKVIDLVELETNTFISLFSELINKNLNTEW